MSTPRTDKYGNREWRNSEGDLHRADGPAIEHASGYRAWYLNDLLHCEDGPAREYADGTRMWFLNGQLHRKDGPAIVWDDGTRMWYLNGGPLTFEQWLVTITDCPQQQTLLRLRWA
jgi:hypothetical protein